ncbi:DJ-1/PfpI family protein [Tenacibaculum xiamenense]|uniref:DJ-1/PfpI family protein n=1 Tax=Tenacibaculum xiamenense TaxID=1261553 RepID=UPI0038931ACB
MKNSFIIIALFLIFTGCSEQKTRKSKDNKEIEEKQLSHDELMASVMPKTHNIKTIGVLVYNGVNSLDVFGPRYILSQIMGTKTKLIALEPGNVTSVTGIEFVPDTTIDQVNELDVLVIPGGFKGTIEAAYDTKVQGWIRKIDKTTTYTTSVCTGAWILGSTGLLKGKKATTNWFRAKEMLAKYGAKFTGKRFTKDGKYWTSAGVTAGMDMSLALLEEIVGRNYAEGVMLDMEYDPFPPFEGGSPEKTNPEVLQFMTAMYAAGVDPIIMKLEKQKPEVNSK